MSAAYEFRFRKRRSAAPVRRTRLQRIDGDIRVRGRQPISLFRGNVLTIISTLPFIAVSAQQSPPPKRHEFHPCLATI